jgi:hypothetical protein
VNETPSLYLRFQGTHTDVFTVTLMEGDNKLAGPVNVIRSQDTKRMVTLCCGLVPDKFDGSYADGKEIAYSLAVIDRHRAYDWLTSLQQ